MRSVNRKKWATLTKFFEVHEVEQDLRVRIIGHIEGSHENATSGRHEVILLKLLSGPLQIELQLAMRQPELALHPFFASHMEVSPSTCPEIFEQAMIEREMGKGESLFKNGEQANNMFFLLKGTMDYRPEVSADDHTSHHKHSIKVGQHCQISEPALWIDWYHTGTCRSLHEAEVIVLDVLAFYKVIKIDPCAMSHALQYAKDIVADMSEVLATTGFVLDLTPDLLSVGRHHLMVRDKAHLKNCAQEMALLRRGGDSWTTYALAHPHKMHQANGELLATYLAQDQDGSQTQAPVQVPATEFDADAALMGEDFECLDASRKAIQKMSAPMPLLTLATNGQGVSQAVAVVPCVPEPSQDKPGEPKSQSATPIETLV